MPALAFTRPSQRTQNAVGSSASSSISRRDPNSDPDFFIGIPKEERGLATAFPATIVTNPVGHDVYGLRDILVDVQILVHWPATSRGFQRPALSARMADTATRIFPAIIEIRAN